MRTRPELPRWLVMLLVSLVGLLIEVGYTRIVSYKLWYYYTYLVIGLALLGFGCGAVLVALWPRLRRLDARQTARWCGLGGGLVIACGYLVVARLPIDTIVIWEYGSRSSFKNLAVLALICLTLFASFVPIGIVVSTLLSRARDDVGRLYFADLLGAGLGCVLAIPLISTLDPTHVVILAAAVMVFVGLFAAPRTVGSLAIGVPAIVVLVVVLAAHSVLPDVRPEATKINPSGALYSEWGPVFRVDVVEFQKDAPDKLLVHDGTYGSGIHRFDGDVRTLSRYEHDSRSLPFATLGTPPPRELIIGSAGGNEILASLYFGSKDIEAVELNPVTVSLLNDRYADYTGHLPQRPEVHLHQGDGRSYLARSDGHYGLIWYVAPDSYAATNAASSGAFVLSESYLYTTQMIRESLERLTPDGIMVAQFGELDAEHRPNRTLRYLTTARKAFEELGIRDPARHMLVATELRSDQGDLSTIVLKRTPFTPAEVAGFVAQVPKVPYHVVQHAPGVETDGTLVAQVAGGTRAQVAQVEREYPKQIGPISDDSPFFWHFSSFSSVLRHVFEPLDAHDPEDVIGERVLLLLLGLATLFAALFLLAPFLAVRRQWVALPAKRWTAIYFGALGLGFMFYEITMIQRLVLFLGYPTLSLTVTLAALLVSTGLGSLLSQRFGPGIAGRLLVALLGLTIFYRWGAGPVMDALQSAPFSARVAITAVMLLPLGLCLGMFMPLGLRTVARIAPSETAATQYVAWAWAVNGFFSVIGSVLTTILSMSLGFSTVQALGFGAYIIGVLVLYRLRQPRAETGPPEPEARAAPALQPSG